jgi:hypothetical protein
VTAGISRARPLALIWALGASLATVLLAAPSAGAVVSTARLIDGPSADLTGDVDAAMAEDGSGGVAYLKRVGGRTRVFAVQFEDGAWGSPQRVDVGQSFDSSWPQIGAGNNGRLLVTWVQEFGVQSDRMYSATMDPGGIGFQTPVPIDLNVGEATLTFPDLAMSRGGLAYLAYNVVTDTSPSNPPGYLGADVRLARYSNRLWSLVGSRVDRNPSIPVRIPNAGIRPRVGIGVEGEGVVSWLEPDDEFVDRVWVRRVFGGQTGISVQASPSTWEERPLRGNVDAFALDVTGFGQASVAFRQLPGQASALTAPRLMVNEMPDKFSEGADTFRGAVLADGGVRGALGRPSVGVDPLGLFLAGFASGASTLAAEGDDFGLYEVRRIDTGLSSIEGDVQVDLAETGAGVAAWRELRGNVGVMRVQERRADGVNESTTLSAPGGGGVAPPVLSGSGRGDALVAWSQGANSSRQVAATVVDAPPDPFFPLLPDGWQRKRRIPIVWDPAPNSIGGVVYSVSVDDEPVRNGVRATSAFLRRRHVFDGRHRIQIFAIDDAGQETGSRTGLLLVDRTPPKVRLKLNGSELRVIVRDGGRRSSSGVRLAQVAFGDGESSAARASRGSPARLEHTFGGGGTYTVVVSARDRAGNRVTRRRKVRVG